jgi:GT2 family glycosyltransferase
MDKQPSGAPKVVVVLLNWNGGSDTIACLDALAHLTYTAWRAIVVDNGSTDDSVVRIRVAHPEVEMLLTGANLGFGGGNNRGIRRGVEEGAEYLWLLNTDAVCEPGALDALVALAEADAGLGAVGSVLYHRDEPERLQAWGGGTVNLWTGISRSAVTDIDATQLDYLTAASVLLRARAIDPSATFDEGYFMYWEDVDLSFRLRSQGWRLGVASESHVLHRSSSSLEGNSALLDRYAVASLLRFMRRHAQVPSVPITLAIGAKLARRAARGDWQRLAAVLRGARDSMVEVDSSRWTMRGPRRP